MDAEEFLEHYGQRGMQWGVRKNIQSRSGEERSEYVKTKDAAWVDKVNANPKLSKVTRIASQDAKRQTKALKKEYKELGLNVKKSGVARTRYDSELKNVLQQSVDRASNKVHGSSPTGLKEVQIHRYSDGSMSATIGNRDNLKIRKQQRQIVKSDVKAKKNNKPSKVANIAVDVTEVAALGSAAKVAYDFFQSDQDNSVLIHTAPTADEYEGLEFRFVLDDEGFVDDILTPFDDEGEDYLEQSNLLDASFEDVIAHYGVRGMRWGVRRSDTSSSNGKSGGTSSQLRKNEAKTSDADTATSKPKWQSPPTKAKVNVVPDVNPNAPIYITTKKKGLFGKEKTVELSRDAALFRVARLKMSDKGIQSLSNEELQVVNNRLGLEKKLREGLPASKKKSSKGKIMVNVLLSEFGEMKLNEFVGSRNPDQAVQVRDAYREARKQKDFIDGLKKAN